MKLLSLYDCLCWEVWIWHNNYLLLSSGNQALKKLYVVVWNVSVVEKKELRLSNISRTSMKRQNFGIPYWSHSVYWQYCCLMLQYCSLLAGTGNKYIIWSSFVWNCRFFYFICFIWKFLTFLFSILTPRPKSIFWIHKFFGMLFNVSLACLISIACFCLTKTFNF